jgi:pyridoxamine 5'-phosphate oxidase-like protein
MPGRRGQITMSDDEVLTFLADQMVMQCATIGPRGLPHLMPLWYVPELTSHPAQAAEPPSSGLQLIGWTYAKSQKARNLDRDPRATVSVEDGVQYHELRGVTLECDVRLEREPARVAAYGLKLFERYAGGITPEIETMVAAQAPKRVGLRFEPTRVMSWDHSKLGGVY